MKNKTILDVAKLSGVSKSTVSNYLNGNFERMSDETNQKIKSAIEALEYTPSLSARRLSSKNHSKTICLAIPRNISQLYDSMYYPVVFSAIGDEAKRLGYNILIYFMDSDNQGQNIEYLKSLASSLVDGILLFDLEEGKLIFREFERSGVPYVCIGKLCNVEDYNYVASDHAGALRQVLNYFYTSGHKKALIITDGTAEGVVEITRNTAFMEFLAGNKEIEKQYQYLRLNWKHRVSDIKLLFNEMLNPANRPTAVCISSCFIDIFMDVVKGYGIQVPEDLSVVILEYYKTSKVMEPYSDFSCVASRVEKVSKTALYKLIRMINTGKPFNSELIPLKLQIKSSSARPK